MYGTIELITPQQLHVVVVVLELQDDALEVLAPGPVLELHMQHDLDAFFVETLHRAEIEALEHTGELDELESWRAVVEAGGLDLIA